MSARPDRIDRSEGALMEPQSAREQAKLERHERRLRRYRYLLPVLILIAFLAWAFTTTYIPSMSMLPTLKPGDHVLTMRAWIAYPGGRMPARGDIIVFALPELPNLEDLGLTEEKRRISEEKQKQVVIPPGSLRHVKGDILIKRVVGLPGETIRIVGRDIFINGKKLEKHFFGGTPSPVTYYNFAVEEPLTLKDDQLFVLGDNIANSEDGRVWGPLNRRNVIGRFVRVLWNDGGIKAAGEARGRPAAKP